MDEEFQEFDLEGLGTKSFKWWVGSEWNVSKETTEFGKNRMD